MNLAVEKEIGHLRSLFWSARDPEGRAFVPLADAYRRAGDYKKALELLNEGLTRLPSFAPGHVVAARLYLEKGLLEEAELASRQALDLDDENTVALEALAGSLQALGRHQEATEVRERLEFLVGTGEAGATPSAAEGLPAHQTDARVSGFAPQAEDEAVDIATLAPDGAETEAVMELEAPAPEEDEAVLDVGALAPEEVDTDAVMDVEALAPAEDHVDAVIDVEALAPEEPAAEAALEAVALSSAETEVEVTEAEVLALEEALTEAVMDLGALAPEEAPAETVTDLEALAPEEAPAETVTDLEALAPEEAVAEAVMDLEVLAPEEAVAEAVMDLEVPAPEEAPVEAVMDLEALAPEEAVAEAVMDLEVLAPEEAAAETVTDLEALAPEEAPAEVVPDADSGELPSDDIPDEPLVTRTMAELYAQQGLADRALEIFSELLSATPEDRELQERVRQLEAASAGSELRVSEPQAKEEEPEDHEWQSAPPDDATGVDTPFAWTDQEVQGDSEGPGISAYFDRVLSWRSKKVTDASDSVEEG